MNINEIQKYYDEKNLQGLLTALQNTFDAIDSYRDILIHGLPIGATCQTLLSQLTGYFMYLNVMFGIAEAELRNEESVCFSKKKMFIENSHGKFIASAIEKEVVTECHLYRRTRNIVEAYMESCRVGISTCQSILKSFSEEHKIGPITA